MGAQEPPDADLEIGATKSDPMVIARGSVVIDLVAYLMSAVEGSPILDDDALAPPARQLHDLVEPLLGSLTGKDSTARQLTIEPHVKTLFCDGSWSLCRRDASTTKG